MSARLTGRVGAGVAALRGAGVPVQLHVWS